MSFHFIIKVIILVIDHSTRRLVDSSFSCRALDGRANLFEAQPVSVKTAYWRLSLRVIFM